MPQGFFLVFITYITFSSLSPAYSQIGLNNVLKYSLSITNVPAFNLASRKMLIKLGLLILLVINATSAGQHSSGSEHNEEGNGDHGSNEENNGAENHMLEITPEWETSSQSTETASPSTKTTSVPQTSTAFEIPAHFSKNYVSTFRKWLRSFASDLYLQILATTPDDENIFFSPYR